MNDQQLFAELRALHEERRHMPHAPAVRRQLLALPLSGTAQGRTFWPPLPTARFQSMFSATKVAVAAAVVVLLGGILLVAQSVRQSALPGAESDPGTFSPTGSLAQPRGFHTATLLPDGRVLVVGGVIRAGNEPTSTVEV